jgi:osmotically inducible lipoprotein OsmB
MNKIIVTSILALALAGCQSSGPNQTIGTGVGALGGYGVARAMGAGPAGSAVGAVAGALVGSSVGQSMDQQNQSQPQRVYVQERPVVVEERYVVAPRRPSCYTVWEPARVPGGYIEKRVCR